VIRGSIGKWKRLTESGSEWLLWREPVTNGAVDFITYELPYTARNMGRDWGVYVGMCSTGRDGSKILWRSDVDIVWSVEQH
jgi:hypothetical protein